MNKSEIGLNAGKVWQLLSDYTRWSYGSLKRKSGLKDKELGAALGWLAREDKIEIHQEEDELYVSLGVMFISDKGNRVNGLIEGHRFHSAEAFSAGGMKSVLLCFFMLQNILSFAHSFQ